MAEIDVEVVFALPKEQIVIAVTLAEGSSVDQAIEKSGVLMKYPEIDLTHIAVGVFGKSCQLEKKLGAGDRVEIYRPLFQNPMEARRNRAIK